MSGRVVQSPYLSQNQAAQFINRSSRTFREYVRKYKIPKYGPSRNLYAEEDLLAFMQTPHCFLANAPKPKPKPRPRSVLFTPVSI